MNLLYALIKGFWIIIPAYVSNASAPLARGEKRMDFGKRLGENELFGAGKTWEGLTLAVGMGTLVGIVEIYSRPYLNPIALKEGFILPEISLTAVFSIALGAMMGDLVASFLKRRAGLERGASAPLLDQLDFLIGGFAAASFFVSLSVESVILLAIITPVIHYISNRIGHMLGAKEVPW